MKMNVKKYSNNPKEGKKGKTEKWKTEGTNIKQIVKWPKSKHIKNHIIFKWSKHAIKRWTIKMDKQT